MLPGKGKNWKCIRECSIKLNYSQDCFPRKERTKRNKREKYQLPIGNQIPAVMFNDPRFGPSFHRLLTIFVFLVRCVPPNDRFQEVNPTWINLWKSRMLPSFWILKRLASYLVTSEFGFGICLKNLLIDTCYKILIKLELTTRYLCKKRKTYNETFWIFKQSCNNLITNVYKF